MMRLAEPLASRTWLFTVGIVLASLVFAGSSFSPTFAQDDAMAEFGDDPVDEAPAEPAGAGAAEQPAGDAAGNGNAGNSQPPATDQSLLEWVFESLGVAYLIVFLALSVTLVSLFVMNMLAARRDTLCPTDSPRMTIKVPTTWQKPTNQCLDKSWRRVWQRSARDTTKLSKQCRKSAKRKA